MIKRVLISGGGTGGHIFPAISIANQIKQNNPEAEILFVGAENKMEMTKVPEAGYNIVGLPIQGFERKISIKNFILIFKLIGSLFKAAKIVRNFEPQVVVGVGGYASGPLLYIASKKGIPTLIQEQNSYAGITNKILSKKAKSICVAYENMEKFFPKDKIVMSGNPVRKDIFGIENVDKDQAYSSFGLDKNKKTILIVGGSLGARTLSNSLIKNIEKIASLDNVQVLCQTGRYYYNNVKENVEASKATNIVFTEFIKQMNWAYSIADVIISRAGAGTISELCIVGKPVILVPSPNVAEDHQTQNALSLVKKEAAILVKDTEATSMIEEAVTILNSNDKTNVLSENIKKLALLNSSEIIVKELERLIK